MQILTYVIDSCFFIDILIAANTGFYKNGVLIMKRSMIIVTYFKTWFFWDLLATFPFDYLSPIILNDQGGATNSKTP